jgi:hypothetical protein
MWRTTGRLRKWDLGNKKRWRIAISIVEGKSGRVHTVQRLRDLKKTKLLNVSQIPPKSSKFFKNPSSPTAPRKYSALPQIIL